MSSGGSCGVAVVSVVRLRGYTISGFMFQVALWGYRVCQAEGLRDLSPGKGIHDKCRDDVTPGQDTHNEPEAHIPVRIGTEALLRRTQRPVSGYASRFLLFLL